MISWVIPLLLLGTEEAEHANRMQFRSRWRECQWEVARTVWRSIRSCRLQLHSVGKASIDLFERKSNLDVKNESITSRISRSKVVQRQDMRSKSPHTIAGKSRISRPACNAISFLRSQSSIGWKEVDEQEAVQHPDGIHHCWTNLSQDLSKDPMTPRSQRNEYREKNEWKINEEQAKLAKRSEMPSRNESVEVK